MVIGHLINQIKLDNLVIKTNPGRCTIYTDDVYFDSTGGYIAIYHIKVYYYNNFINGTSFELLYNNHRNKPFFHYNYLKQTKYINYYEGFGLRFG